MSARERRGRVGHQPGEWRRAYRTRPNPAVDDVAAAGWRLLTGRDYVAIKYQSASNLVLDEAQQRGLACFGLYKQAIKVPGPHARSADEVPVDPLTPPAVLAATGDPRSRQPVPPTHHGFDYLPRTG